MRPHRQGRGATKQQRQQQQQQRAQRPERRTASAASKKQQLSMALTELERDRERHIAANAARMRALLGDMSAYDKLQ